MSIRFDETFIKKHKRSGEAKTPILFFHSWSAQGGIEYQGYIFSLKRDGTGMAQLFDWFMGEPSDEMVFTKHFLECCTFYATDQEMNRAYRAHTSKTNRNTQPTTQTRKDPTC